MDHNEENTTVLSSAQTVAAYATVAAALVSATYVTVTLGIGLVETVADQRAQRRARKSLEKKEK